MLSPSFVFLLIPFRQMLGNASNDTAATCFYPVRFQFIVCYVRHCISALMNALVTKQSILLTKGLRFGVHGCITAFPVAGHGSRAV
jgi:hypothetical protein